MANENNPAGRLYDILSAARGNNGNNSVKKVWSTVFGIPESELHKIYYYLTLLLNLVEHTEKEIKLTPNIDHQLYLRPFGPIKSVLAVSNFDTSWANHSRLLNEAVMTGLQFCSERLSQCRPDNPAVDELKDLKAEVNGLFESIQSSNIDTELKSVLLDFTESMLRALTEYRLRGISGLRQDLFSILDKLQRNFKVVEQHKSEPIVQKFWGVLAKYDMISSIALNTPTVLTGFGNLLGM
jgi:hypothetical protein